MGARTITKSVGPSSSNVRRSIGEWECGKPDARSTSSPLKSSPSATIEKSNSTTGQGLSIEAVGSPPKVLSSKTSDRINEARNCVIKAKTLLTNSRNLKTDIKAGVIHSIDRLFELVKESEAIKGSRKKQQQIGTQSVSEKENSNETEIVLLLHKQTQLIKENNSKMELLRKALQESGQDECSSSHTSSVNLLVNEVRELRKTSELTNKAVTAIQESGPSYADVLARPSSGVMSPSKRSPKHSIIVSSEIERDTSDEVLGKVREALEAKTSGLQVTRIQKVRNQKVVLSCASREELLKVRDKIATKSINLQVEEAKNKDPLIILKNLLAFNKDDDIISSLKSQNKKILGDLTDLDFRAAVKYRRRARNPHENHVILQVSPKVWQRLIGAGRVHIDLQYLAVEDQSPLVQCTRCLGYGHGRRLCKESEDLCSHCAGPHLRANCEVYLSGDTPTCRNCRSARCSELGHSAFDKKCPVRKRWDAIARASVAYC